MTPRRWIDGVMAKFGYRRGGRVSTAKAFARGYAAAQAGRLTAGWKATNLSADEEIRYALNLVRNRSRELERNNDHMRRFLSMLQINVIGGKGIGLQVKARDPNGNPDNYANKLLEVAWEEWGKKRNASVCGKLSWIDLQKLAIRSVARDGEILFRKVRGWKGNRFKFALQPLEADYLDVNLNRKLDNGNRIKMGVEIDAWGRAVAYHLLVNHPGDTGYIFNSYAYERIPADEMIHLFIQERPGQTRGIPWAHSAMMRLQMLGAYEEAELVAARVGASKMGFFTTSPDSGELKPNYDDVDTAGNLIQEAEPGTFEQLPAGMKLESFSPDHPAGNFGPFIKSMLRGISVGIGVSYNSFASDLEGVSFSSIRQGTLEDRDSYKALQMWVIEHLCEDVYEAWLDMALLSGAVNLPYVKFDKFNSPRFMPRGWPWVDPLKDITADIAAVNAGLVSRSEVLADDGKDVEEVFAQIKREKDLALTLGLEFKETPINYMEVGNAQNN